MDLADYKFLVVTVLFLGVSCAFQIVGVATPAWIVMTLEVKEEYWYFGVGLWKLYYCHGDNCKFEDPLIGSSGLTKGSFKGEEGNLEQQIETAVAVTFLGLAMLFAFVPCLRLDPGNIQYQPRVTGSLALISGLMALIAVGRMTAAIIIAKERVEFDLELLTLVASQLEVEFKFPYSLLLTGIGGLLACVTGIGAIVKGRRKATLPVGEVHDQQVDMEPVAGMWVNDRERLSSSYY